MDPLKLFKIQQGQKKQESGSSIKEDPQQPKSAESNKQMQFSPVKQQVEEAEQDTQEVLFKVGFIPPTVETHTSKDENDQLVIECP